MGNIDVFGCQAPLSHKSISDNLASLAAMTSADLSPTASRADVPTPDDMQLEGSKCLCTLLATLQQSLRACLHTSPAEASSVANGGLDANADTPYMPRALSSNDLYQQLADCFVLMKLVVFSYRIDAARVDGFLWGVLEQKLMAVKVLVDDDNDTTKAAIGQEISSHKDEYRDLCVWLVQISVPLGHQLPDCIAPDNYVCKQHEPLLALQCIQQSIDYEAAAVEFVRLGRSSCIPAELQCQFAQCLCTDTNAQL